ncbi:MAG: 3-methyl-2-oxobutanoate hydroxymethyltransferase [Deltaproteobacteria bacterium]|nr:3-methyl-2-oxobutanoate hydroxymethyltransferase [Deltaproteobacteria bacterium]
MTEKKITTAVIRERKIKGAKITMLTAYDYATAMVLDNAGVDIILVGDSLGMVVLGYESTLPVTMEEMLHHTKAASRGTRRAMLIADMPFLSYQVSDTEAMLNAGRFLKEAGAQGVKLEGGREMAGLIRKMTAVGIPVMAHLGLTPQSVLQFGGHKIQGKEDAAANRIMEDARMIEDAGAFSVVLECVPAPLAAKITKALSIPTIGIGAGVECDGQVLVINDMLGMFERFTPKFVKKYCNLNAQMKDAVRQYIDEVKSGKFPDEEHSY